MSQECKCKIKPLKFLIVFVPVTHVSPFFSVMETNKLHISRKKWELGMSNHLGGVHRPVYNNKREVCVSF